MEKSEDKRKLRYNDNIGSPIDRTQRDTFIPNRRREDLGKENSRAWSLPQCGQLLWGDNDSHQPPAHSLPDAFNLHPSPAEPLSRHVHLLDFPRQFGSRRTDFSLRDVAGKPPSPSRSREGSASARF